MKIQIQASELATAAAWAARLAPPRPPAPITAGVLITTEDGQLTLSATDYDQYGTVTVGDDSALIPDGGQAVVSARLLAEITKTVRRDDEMLIETSARGLEVCCGRSRWVLPQLDIDLWPVFPDLGDPLGQVDATVLTRGLSRVLPAVDPDGTLPVLTGVELTADSELLTCAATDRYRLAVADLHWKPLRTPLDNQSSSVTVPGELLRLTLAALTDHPEPVTLHSDGNTIALATTRHRVTGRLLDAQYPRWRPVIPSDTPTSVTVTTTALDLATTQVTVGGINKTTTIRLVVTEHGVDVSHGDHSAHVRSHRLIGEPTTVGIAPRYLQTALTGVDSPTVTLRITPRQIILVPADEDGEPLNDGYLHLVMTKHLGEAAS